VVSGSGCAYRRVGAVILNDQVTVLTRATQATDGHGNPTVDWGSETTAIVPAVVSPSSSSENLTREDVVITRWRIFLPATVVMTAKDRVQWRGYTFEVDGDVELHIDRRARPHHLEAMLVAVLG
jgi:hypothetical protein